MPKFLFWALLLKTALVYFWQEQFLILGKQTELLHFQLKIINDSLMNSVCWQSKYCKTLAFDRHISYIAAKLHHRFTSAKMCCNLR